MVASDETSGAALTPQENEGTTAVVPEASEGNKPVQETPAQEVSAELDDVALEKLLAHPKAQKKLASLAQSEADKREHRLRMEWEQRAAEERRRQDAIREQERLANLPDDEFRQEITDKQRREDVERQAREAALAERQKEDSKRYWRAFDKLRDDAARAEIQAEVQAGKYQTADEAIDAINERIAQLRVAQERARWEETHKKAESREKMAEQVEVAAAVTDAGLPLASAQKRKLTTDENLAEGFAEELVKLRKGG